LKDGLSAFFKNSNVVVYLCLSAEYDFQIGILSIFQLTVYGTLQGGSCSAISQCMVDLLVFELRYVAYCVTAKCRVYKIVHCSCGAQRCV